MTQKFIETQRRKLMTMMQKFWAQRSATFAQSATQSQSAKSRLDRWIAVDLKFFDSIYDEKFTITIDSMQHVDKDTYFRDVHSFIDRIKNIAVIKKTEIVRNNLYTCLRNIVMIWYTIELFEKVKKLVKTRNNLDVWKRYLIKRFRDKSNVIMIIITRKRYIMNDARRRRESREYANVIMRTARSAELESKTHQIMMIYNDLDLKFQRDISMLTLIIQIQNFLQHLDDKKDIWWNLVNRNRNYTIQIAKSWVNYSSKSNASYQSKFQSQFSIYYQSKFDQYDSQYSRQRNSEYFQRDQFFYQYDVNQSYQSQSQIFSSAKQLKSSKSRFQITNSEQQSEFAFFSKSYSSRFDQNNNREEYDRRQSLEKAWNNQNRNNNYNRNKAQEAYADAIEKNQDLEDSRNIQKHCEKSEFTTDEQDKKNYDSYESKKANDRAENFNYFLNEDEYHIDTKMINQKMSKIHQCRKFKKKFSFNNKLHQHIRECRKTLRNKALTIETFHLNETSFNRIIISSAKSEMFKDLAFRSWHFVTFVARIFKNESLNKLYANFECIMSLIDKAYLWKFCLRY